VTTEELRKALGNVAQNIENIDGVTPTVTFIRGLLARPDKVDDKAPRPAHQPGEHHDYRIECEVCGQRGTFHLSIEPQMAS